MKILLVALFSILAFSAQAVSITCKGNIDNNVPYKDFGVAITDVLDLPCNLYAGGRQVHLEISGLGLTLHGSMASGVVLSCPFTKHFNEDQLFVGFQAEVACIVGGGCGIFFGKDGVCTFAKGTAGSLGAGASIGAIRFVTH